MTEKKHLIFIGAPGSGKGTQARRLVKEFGFEHISTGDILRKEIADGTELGKEVKEIIDQGKLVEDELMGRMLKANVDLEKSAYIFDGFPRTENQAKILDGILEGANSQAIYFKVDLEDLIVRITNRRICQSCGTIHNLITKPLKENGACTSCDSLDILHRKDDNEEVLRKRMSVYEAQTSPLLDLYAQKGRLSEINASDDIEDIYKAITKLI